MSDLKISSDASSSRDSAKAAPGLDLGKLPRKCFYRQRAHCNPLSDSYLNYPPSPDYVDWRLHYPEWFQLKDCWQLFLNTNQYPVHYDKRQEPEFNGRRGPRVEILDVGCGYGGLSLSLAEAYPSVLILGMEIREKVTTYLGQKIRGLRVQFHDTRKYSNVSVIRTNVMKFLVNYFRKAQFSKLFFCFPDPHFKKSNERRRILGPALLSTYAYVLKPGGRLYTITDVKALYDWIYTSLTNHPLFQEICVNTPSLQDDPCVHLMYTTTEEGKKAKKLGKEVFSCVFRRI